MHAQPMARRVRQRVNEAADERSLRGRQLGILSATGIDREGLASDQARDVIRIETRGIHDLPRGDRFLFGPHDMAAGSPLTAEEGSAGQEYGACRARRL